MSRHPNIKLYLDLRISYNFFFFLVEKHTTVITSTVKHSSERGKKKLKENSVSSVQYPQNTLVNRHVGFSHTS